MKSIEDEFSCELEIFRGEAESGAQFFYSYLAVHELAKRDRRLFRLLASTWDGLPAFGDPVRTSISWRDNLPRRSSIKIKRSIRDQLFHVGHSTLARALPRFLRSPVEQTTRGLLYVKGFFDPRHRSGVRNTLPGCPPGRG